MNIEDYLFQDMIIEKVEVKNDINVHLHVHKKASSVLIYKRDAIALAKHFKLTKEDIEE